MAGAGAINPSIEAARLGWPGALLHSVVSGVFAGGLAGAIAGGLGGRLAMRITAIMATASEQGSLTEAEETVGEITVGGTMGLVVFGGVLLGLAGGLLYAALAPWFRDAGLWRGLAFGAYLLGVLGWTVIEGDNFDFATLGSLVVNVAMYSAIFVLFGVLIAWAYDWFRDILPVPSLSLGAVLAVPVYALGVLLSVGAIALMLSAMGEDGREAPLYAIIPMLLFAASIGFIVWRHRRAKPFTSLSSLQGKGGERAAAIAVLAVPLLIGLAMMAQSLAEMAGDAY